MRPTGLEPPFVGRDRELRLLKESLHATGEERTARLLSIVGLAGIGKSRLAWEFFKYVDGVTETIWWHRGRCLAYGEGVAYWALNEMVRMRCGIVENEPPETAREKLRRTVEEFAREYVQRQAAYRQSFRTTHPSLPSEFLRRSAHRATPAIRSANPRLRGRNND